MYENNEVTQGAQTAPQKKSGSWVWLICILAGLILFILGYALFRAFGAKSSLHLTDYSESFSVSDVKELNMEIDWADLSIEQSEDNNIYVDAKNVPEGFGAEVKNGTFRTYHSKKKIKLHNLVDFWKNEDDETTVTILLPKKEYNSFILELGTGETTVSDILCNKMKIDCGAGEVNLKNVKCSTGDFNCGAGEVNITDINCEGKFKIDGGAGDVNISGVLGGIDADQGLGEFEFIGTINGDIDADGGVGEMTFRLTNPQEDFDRKVGKYKLDVDTGIGAANVYYDQG
ncbi:MAG: DUF4097 family beta strand repeat protein [Ruminococcus sp.]|uniref:DUF4097 family beta strand repeat-containing protein n=1 Tax=Ruminococcus sp. TaxID=41978 RepID=UPI0025E66E03|nr:DUF4097 family beta strand repeat-containing protein [Ruminococcus sp.]MBR5684290.1 DUF4097 family beta strand repeat protein [Ruminococcus sp.]